MHLIVPAAVLKRQLVIASHMGCCMIQAFLASVLLPH